MLAIYAEIMPMAKLTLSSIRIAGVAFFATGINVSCLLSSPAYHGPVTDHFNGETFNNAEGNALRGLGDFLKWQWSRKRGPWREFVDAAPGPPPPVRVAGGAIRVTYVNHATLLIQMDGMNFLTDPIWSQRASPVGFAGPVRVRPPGIRFEDLPPIDIVLVSHNHYDHMDLSTLERLRTSFAPRVFTGLGNAEFLLSRGITNAHDLDWWQSIELNPGVRLISVPAQHFSGRGTIDQNATLWTGFVIEGPSGRVYFAGDTGYGSHFRAARERLGPMRVALLPIGAYEPRWFMRSVHMSPRDAIRAAIDLEATTSIAMHFGTFPLADDGEEQPLYELARALAQDGRLSPDRFLTLGFGEGRLMVSRE
jgi:L-ascorbate metabolism protein UlaG (beta-lactamase superfamily)